jgi:hypothetical protein
MADPAEINPSSDPELEQLDRNANTVEVPEPQRTPDQPVNNVPSASPAQVTLQQDVTQSDIFNPPLLSPAESIARAQSQPPATDPQAQAADFVSNTNAGVLAAIRNNPAAGPLNTSTVTGSLDSARKEGVSGVQKNSRQQDDWRVRLQLARDANYLYSFANQGDLLYPLKTTNGVIFPYTPQIQMNYKANYEPIELVHTNYKQHFYKNSGVDEVNIVADFTAQDTSEALYMLAVIHFFRSVTKMFYGQDGNNGPSRGTPPPLCYLSGLGQFQFNEHPLVISNFSYSLPNDVDYIRAGSTTQYAGVNLNAYSDKSKGFTSKYLPGLDRLFGSNLKKGGVTGEPAFQSLSNSQATYVPTKIQIQLSALPIVTRRNTADVFSLEKYATGELIKKGFW